MIFQLVTPVGGLEEKSKTFWLLVQMLCHWATGDFWKLRLLIYNQRQNELIHFALNWAFSCCIDFKRRKYSFSSPIPSVQCCATNTPTPQLWMEWGGEGRGAGCFVLWSYPIWVQCLNNFVADCRFMWQTSFILLGIESREGVLKLIFC